MFLAGLWPFHSPRNKVSWLSHSNGLLFGKYGSIASAGVLKANPLQAESSCGLEIWLEPKLVDGEGTVLGFYWPDSGIVPFAIRQYRSGLELEKSSRDAKSATVVLSLIHILFWEFWYIWWIFLRHGFHVIQGCNPPDDIFLIALPFKLFGVRYIFDHHDAIPELYLCLLYTSRCV